MTVRAQRLAGFVKRLQAPPTVSAVSVWAPHLTKVRDAKSPLQAWTAVRRGEQAAIAYKLLLITRIKSVLSESEVLGSNLGSFCRRPPKETQRQCAGHCISSAPPSSSSAMQRTSVPTNPFAFFLFSRALSLGAGFNIGEM